MKTVCIILLLGLFSCSKGIYKSAQIIKKMQVNKYPYYDDPESLFFLEPDSLAKDKNQESQYVKEYKKTRQNLDSLYANLFMYRKKNVNKFINNKKLKDFVLVEFYGYKYLSSEPDYWGYVIEKDSIYWVDNNKIIKSKKLPYNTTSISCLVYTFQGNSVIINRGIDIDTNSNCKQQTNKELFSDYPFNRNMYLSNYKNGKLNLLMYKDSIVYENKTNMVFKLEEEKYFNKDLQEYCILKQDIMKCKDLTFKCKRYDGLVMFCDTIK